MVIRKDEAELNRVRNLWDRTAAERAQSPVQGWLDSALVLESYVQPRVSGSPRVNWLIGIANRLGIPRGGRWLSLGCGAAGQEIFAARSGLFASLVALDASQESIEKAREAAAAQGVGNIEFGSVDLNRVDLPREAYDVVLMNMSLHHVRRLRETLAMVERALRPQGHFIINEFIGPRQFQFTNRQLDIVRRLLEVLPEAYRKQSTTGGIKEEYVRLPVDHWNQADPSEAIRSDRILPEIRRRFYVLERMDYGGTILNLLLEHIIHNFDPQNEKDAAIIGLLAQFEDILIRSGVLPSDFTVMVMRKRPGWRERLRRFLP